MKTTSRVIADNRLKISYDDAVLEQDVEWFLNYSCSIFDSNIRLKTSTIIQVGMMLVKFKNTGEEIEVFEPDMIGIPINFTKGITNTLRILRLQKDVYESLDINTDIAFPNLREAIVQCAEWEDATSYILERTESSGNNSGWYIGCTNPEHDHEDPKNLKTTSIYDILISHRDILPFLALPSNTAVLVENDRAYVSFEGVEKPPKLGSYLRARLESGF